MQQIQEKNALLAQSDRAVAKEVAEAINIDSPLLSLENLRNISSYLKQAEAQLAESQKIVQKYYETNLSQIKAIFIIGAVVIAFGLLVILCTMIYAFKGVSDPQPLVVVSGFAGGLLVDCVGAVFIAMYSKISESANEFVKQIIDTITKNNVTSMINIIQNDDLRDQTVADVAKVIAAK